MLQFVDVQFRLHQGVRSAEKLFNLTGKLWTQDIAILDYFKRTYPCDYVRDDSSRMYKRHQVEAEKHLKPPHSNFVPVVAFHGWLDNCNSFDILMPHIFKRTNQNLVILALDAAGHGLSDHRPFPAGYMQHLYLRDAMEVLNEQLGWERYFLIGHSAGGALASLVAATFPEQVLGLMAIESIGVLTRKPESGPAMLRQYVLDLRKLNEKRLPAYRSFEQAIEVRIQGATQGGLSQEGAEALVERNLVLVENKFQWRTDPLLRTPSGFYYTEAAAEMYLKSIKCPVLFVAGTEAKLELPWIDLETRWSWLQCRKYASQFEGGHHLHCDADGAAPKIAYEFARFIENPLEFQPIAPLKSKL